MPEHILLDEMTRDEVREIAPRATLVLPTASTEQHGPHLPLMTDSAIGSEIGLKAASLASREVPVVVAPVVPFGNSQHHLIFSALSLQSETYVPMVTNLMDCAAKAGFKRIFVLNSHGGNEDAIRMVARDTILQTQVTIGVCSYWAVAKDALVAAGLDPNWAFPGHSGGFETSMMMALRPNLVRRDKMPLDAGHPKAIGNQGIANGLLVVRHGEWQRIGGYSDAPLSASAETGQRLFEIVCGEVSRAIVAFHQASSLSEK